MKMLFGRSSGVSYSLIIVIWLITLMSCFLASAFGAMTTLLPDDEVNALQEIGNLLGKTWDFSVDPCSGQSGWATASASKESLNAVTCNCSFPDGTCHVISIALKSQGLQGVLPAGELVKLPYLNEIDLSRNYLSGRIPAEWGSMALVNISLLGNRLSGVIPMELGNITTLGNLTLEANQFSGPLPPELGQLVNIERILISSNYFTGPLPETLEYLTNLRDFRISQNNFTGQIPSFIGNWITLEKLAMQASGLEGPIPPEMSYLTSLTDLRISDIIGAEMEFPPLGNMASMKTLILKSCNIIGPLPDNLGGMKKLKELDLSFNKLVGEIPSSYVGLVKVKFMYLTGNLLNGTVPDWMKKVQSIDLSYNNFSYGSSGLSDCQLGTINLYGSSSLAAKNLSGDVPCLKSLTCSKIKGSSLHINCGGYIVRNGSTTYEDDQDSGGPSKFFHRNDYIWGFSSTGNFMDNDNDIDTYITPNVSMLLMRNPELYTKARLSPLSLTYYGYCLLTGNYTVNLHFAEIMFTNDHNYSSLGRRIFDVYIQGQLVLKDFNIVDEAGGVGKAVTRNFSSIAVMDGTIEIRFYWAGKGTTALPSRGTYGPLISAIAVDPEFTLPEGRKKISTAAVIGIVASVVTLTFVVLGILWWRGCLGHKNMMHQELRGLDLQTGSFTLRQIKAATNNFDPTNKIGEGGFGSVYKGLLSDGTIIAVKQLSSKSKQGNREFVNEIGMISALQHPHLVKLYGCCIEGDQLLLVYEYMENNCLARALFGSECKLKLDWPTRQKICIGIARGLAFLHEESRLKIVHRDIKATNVLLDEHLNPKISDFGLAKLNEEENTHISTRIAGTIGYMAPEYATRGYLTDKADVYSFGIVALEIVSGKSITSFRLKENSVYLLDWALFLKERGNLMELVDERLGLEFNEEEVLTMLNVALLCTNASPILRPTMSVVVTMLEGRAAIQEFVPDSITTVEDMKFKAIKNHCQDNQDQSTAESFTHSTSVGGPGAVSSGSVPDLYPVNPDSSYWNDRSHYLNNQDQSTTESLTHSTSIGGPSSGSVPDLYPVNPDSSYWNDRSQLSK